MDMYGLRVLAKGFIIALVIVIVGIIVYFVKKKTSDNPEAVKKDFRKTVLIWVAALLGGAIVGGILAFV